MQLAGDRVTGRHTLAHCQLARELGGHLAVVAHLLVLAPHQFAPCLQLAPFLPSSTTLANAPMANALHMQ